MSADKTYSGDASHIAQEVVNDAAFQMRSKCRSVFEIVNDKISPLESALKLYRVPQEAYVDFLAKKQAEELKEQTNSNSAKETMILKMHVYERIFELTFNSLDQSSFEAIINVFRKVSKEIEEDKVVLKETASTE